MVRCAVIVICSLALGVVTLQGATYPPARSKDLRKLIVWRVYRIPVTRGKKVVAGIPAMMSFWGATNQQVVVASETQYSVNPDAVRMTADKDPHSPGSTARRHELTWNSPDTDVILIGEKLTVEISFTSVLHTAARLPYDPGTLASFAELLTSDASANPDNERVARIAREISAQSPFAEEAVELACDWVNDHIEFQSGSPAHSDTVVATGKGNCVGMSNLAVAILRRMGIPAQTVNASFVAGGGHKFLEAYFPDAGWVFYDPANHTRGFKSLDCLMAVGSDYWIETENGRKRMPGAMKVEDATRYTEDSRMLRRILRNGPQATVAGVTVFRQVPPPSVKVRHQSLQQLMLDLTIPPGKREYSEGIPPTSSDRRMPSSAPSGQRVPSKGSHPADPSGSPGGGE